MKKYISLLLVLFFTTTLFATEYKLSGIITDLGEYPIANAEVVLLGLDVRCETDEKGYFLLEGGVSVIDAIEASSSGLIQGNRLYLPTGTAAQIQIFNLLGAQIAQRSLTATSYQQSLTLDELFSGISDGLFILRMQSNDGLSSFKVLNQSGRISVQQVLQRVTTSNMNAQLSRGARALDTLAVVVNDKIKIRMPLSSLIDSDIKIGLNILPAVYTKKVKEIPDYWQLDGAYGGFKDGGQVFCGPTTVSNSLMWLCDDMGFTKLAYTWSDRKKAQHKMIELLGSKDYMNLGSGGIGPWGICDGVNKYFKFAGVKFKSMKYEGFRNIQAAWDTGKNKPSMESIKRGIMGKGSVWLNFGWYKYSSSKNTYNRTGGHWMTLVGYGYDGKSKDPNCLIVHDPWTGKTFNNYRKLTKITSGRLTGSASGLPQNASGYYKYWTGSKWGILDGIVVLDME